MTLPEWMDGVTVPFLRQAMRHRARVGNRIWSRRPGAVGRWLHRRGMDAAIAPRWERPKCAPRGKR